MVKKWRVRWGGHVFMGDIRNQYRILARDTALQIPLGHHRCKWENVNLLESVSLLTGLSWLRIGMSCGFL
jgi:hypothetical protein